MRERAIVGISDMPELRRMVEHVKGSQMPILLQAEGEPMALLSPISARPRRLSWRPSREHLEDALATFGVWNGRIDTEGLKQNARAARGSNRREVDL